MENVKDLSKVRDLRLDERTRWIAEVTFLKAYYHYYLLRMYGPIPLVDVNIDISAPEEEVRIKRKPFDECVNYISDLLDQAAPNLPSVILDRTTELGRITRPIALAIKAKLWLMAASPLFNGNPDYTSFKDKDGVALFPASYDATKWDKAAEYSKAAIDAAEAGGHSLHRFLGTTFQLSDTTLQQLNIRTAMTERWSTEHVWANPNSRAGFDMQARAMPKLAAEASGQARMQFAAPMKIVEMFYSSHGVPINEDKLIDFSNRYTTRLAVSSERFYIKEGYETARINFDREPRFYAFLSFDGGVWYKYDSPSNTDENTWVVEAKYTQASGATDALGFLNETGYFIKKLVDWNATHTNSNQGINYRDYPWPEIRLPDLYLMYAEALNESQGPVGDVLLYLDKIRTRAGLEGVAAAWSKYSTNPSKYTTKDGMRDIIHQERGIELSFEGQRFWDLRRWKKAAESINQAITGWSVYQDKTADYYRVRTIYTQNFVSPRDYLWPIRIDDLRVNPNLVQNPGW
ncbi:RagB/SusD family nutrient uptake outer membrane protein [Niabella hibiscisoli]|uniref:RagB/SusD family nutrient uptake outer membrane protein n=1 Tax=Niabella hibiscisoli TaxID=1825928 RepID=UPI001F0FFAE9|nr:RagB/SusD family nutrient uptake outer membrane protein [Niabella hibiscisoli]MCH5716465.1 RagB/SusD family nutrient uptake outer membrane protein [Niabella hibiscisoli]